MDRRTFVKSAAVTVPAAAFAGGIGISKYLRDAGPAGRASTRSMGWRDVDAGVALDSPVLRACAELGDTHAIGGTAANLVAGRACRESQVLVDAPQAKVIDRLGKAGAVVLPPHPWDAVSDLRLRVGDDTYTVGCLSLDLYRYRSTWSYQNRRAPFKHMAVALDVKKRRLHDPEGYADVAREGEVVPSSGTSRSFANVMLGYREAARHRLAAGAAFSGFVAEVVRLRGRDSCATVVQLLDGFPALYAVMGPEGLGRFLNSPMPADALSRELGFKADTFASRLAEASRLDGGRRSPEVVALSCLFANGTDADPRDVANLCFLRQGQVPSNVGMVREAIDMARQYQQLT